MNNLLELFSGTGSISKVFKAHGWQTFTVDTDFDCHPDLCWPVEWIHSWDITDRFIPDVIWASPPCTTFSVASIGKHWNPDHTPKTKQSTDAIELVRKTIELINELKPKYWFIENPRGMMRTLPMMFELPRYTVTYCQYGDTRMKPTDVWTNHPNPNFKPMCKNGDTCHEPAPRGSRTGTQGLLSARERGRIPSGFCEYIYELV
jgi:hypothetical protein